MTPTATHILRHSPNIWRCAITKRLIDLDDDLLAAARGALGTEGISETVRAALHQAVSAAARAAEIEWLSEGGLEPMASPEARGEVWR